eukprot:CAMPEP_0170184988 /NCGR_PEP_ID=MMETSP0040_2-20121228/35279_1 /TAXON_ID=641309 /ORGANISM="Lotharella oceanica, Strain CCMP622" /LENGTH=287 /DNA_ID=CAMNT_0010431239 /DNA_START=15 /DNA_END=879 /DNA_ORIENTATION=-
MPRYIVVTGANKGIGFAIVRKILGDHDDTYVFLGSRNMDRGNKALAELTAVKKTWGSRVTVVQLDVVDQKSVDAAVQVVKAKLGSSPLYGVVNNAGFCASFDAPKSAVEVERHINVNTYGPKRVTDAFLPLLEKKQGRVVMVSSAAGPMFVRDCSTEVQAKLTSPNITWSEVKGFVDDSVAMATKGEEAYHAKGLPRKSPYYLSKALLNCLTMIYAKTYPNLVVSAVTPGFIETDLTRSALLSKGGKTAKEMGMKTTAEGAHAPCKCLFAKLKGVGGIGVAMDCEAR